MMGLRVTAKQSIQQWGVIPASFCKPIVQVREANTGVVVDGRSWNGLGHLSVVQQQEARRENALSKALGIQLGEGGTNIQDPLLDVDTNKVVQGMSDMLGIGPFTCANANTLGVLCS